MKDLIRGTGDTGRTQFASYNLHGTKWGGAGRPLNGTDAAQDRALWREGLLSWLQTTGIPHQGQLYDNAQVYL